MKMQGKILAVSTSAHRYEEAGYRTGLWLGELTHFYDVLVRAGYEVDIASVAGGPVPIDPVSLMPPVLAMGGTDQRYADPTFMALLDQTPALADVNLADYDGIFLAGGHGTMFDFVGGPVSEAVTHFADAGKIVSAVCHGPAGLLGVRLSNGQTLLEGKQVTGFSMAEEKAADRADCVPFHLEERLAAEGVYDKAAIPMAKHVVVDGNLITGQNPTSAAGVGQAVAEALAQRA